MANPKLDSLRALDCYVTQGGLEPWGMHTLPAETTPGTRGPGTRGALASMGGLEPICGRNQGITTWQSFLQKRSGGERPGGRSLGKRRLSGMSSTPRGLQARAKSAPETPPCVQQAETVMPGQPSGQTRGLPMPRANKHRAPEGGWVRPGWKRLTGGRSMNSHSLANSSISLKICTLKILIVINHTQKHDPLERHAAADAPPTCRPAALPWGRSS